MRRVFSIALVLAVALSGCIYSREINRTKRTIEREFPGAEFDQKIVLSIGSFGLRAAGWFVDLADDDDIENLSRYVSDIDRIKVGIYDTESLPAIPGAGSPILRELVDQGWEPAVQVREEGEHVWILYRARRDRIRDVLVIVLNDEELVIARLKGHLDRLVKRAVDDYRPFTRFAGGGSP